MGRYWWRALDFEGHRCSGWLYSQDRAEATQRLQRQGYASVQLYYTGWISARVSSADLVWFTQQLQALLAVGLELSASLALLQRDMPSAGSRAQSARLIESISAGTCFSEALKQAHFPTLYCALIAYAEAHACLPQILKALLLHYEAEAAWRERLFKALSYPLLLLCTLSLSTIFLVWTLLPSFEVLYQEAGATIPEATQRLIKVCHGMRRYGVWGAAILGSAVLLKRRAVLMFGRRLLPTFFRQRAAARFARVVALSGVVSNALLDQLVEAPELMADPDAYEALQAIVARIHSGQALCEALREVPFFPCLLTQVVGVGEASGQLSALLLKIADYYDVLTGRRLQQLLRYAEPLLTLGMGVLCAYFVRLLYLPLLELGETLL